MIRTSVQRSRGRVRRVAKAMGAMILTLTTLAITAAVVDADAVAKPGLHGAAAPDLSGGASAWVALAVAIVVGFAALGLVVVLYAPRLRTSATARRRPSAPDATRDASSRRDTPAASPAGDRKAA